MSGSRSRVDVASGTRASRRPQLSSPMPHRENVKPCVKHKLCASPRNIMPKSAVSLLRPAGTSSSCLLRALGLSAILDRRLGIETTPVGCRFGVDTEIGPTVQLSVPSPLSEEEKGASILRMPLAHQGLEKAAHTCCPVLADDELPQFAGGAASSCRLGAVAIPVDGQGRVLLTRRPRAMRTFPGCWVLPGGSVDPSDRSVCHAALRELEEETGLRATTEACTPLCLWESCYPTTIEGWRAARQQGTRTAHFLVAFVAVSLPDVDGLTTPLRLQPSECDLATWVPLRDVATVLSDSEDFYAAAAGPAGLAGAGAVPYARAPVAASSAGKEACGEVASTSATGEGVTVAQLRGVYPNAIDEGIGRGHLFALRCLARQQASAGPQQQAEDSTPPPGPAAPK